MRFSYLYVILLFFIINLLGTEPIYSANKNRLYQVYLPDGYNLKTPKKISFKRKGIKVHLYARKFAQGTAVYVEILRRDRFKNDSLEVKSFTYNGKSFPLTKRAWGVRALFPIHAKEKPGRKKIIINYSIGWSSHSAEKFIWITKTKFYVAKRSLNLGGYSNITKREKPWVRKFIRTSYIKKRKAFKIESRDILKGPFSHPRDMHKITSPFWATRLYMRYKIINGKKKRMKNRVKYHRGLDLKGYKNTDVYAMAKGRVILASRLYFEGNIVILDHGNRVFSYYMHLQNLKVMVGDIVNGGDIVGLVGSTGFSTASHLHVSFVIRGTQVNPLSILPLPVR